MRLEARKSSSISGSTTDSLLSLGEITKAEKVSLVCTVYLSSHFFPQLQLIPWEGAQKLWKLSQISQVEH